MNTASIFKRYEVKFIITEQQYMRIMPELINHGLVLDRFGRSTVQSLYFDTPDYSLIRASLESPPYKEKIRARSYGTASGDDKVYLELKKKFDHVVYKRRIELLEKELRALPSCSLAASALRANSGNTGALGNAGALGNLGEKGSAGRSQGQEQIAKELSDAFDRYPGLRPRVLICCEREPWCEPLPNGFRVTFDRNIRWRDQQLDLHSGDHGRTVLPDELVLMELKTAMGIPLWMTRILTQEKIYKTSFSKYGRAYAAILRRDGDLQRASERLRQLDLIEHTHKEGIKNYEFSFSRAV